MRDFQLAFPKSVRLQARLAPYSWWRIGGPADALAEVQGERQLIDIIAYLKGHKIPWCLIGRGTNLLFDDLGFRGCVLRLGHEFANINFSEGCLNVQAGCWTPSVALSAARKGLSGLEHTIGIPASFGGLVCMNGGSQRKGVGDLVETVRALAPDGQIIELDHAVCDFAYRQSRFQSSGEIVLSVTLNFEKRRTYAEQRPDLLNILRERRRKFPRKLPSCGSVFKSSPELYQACGPPGKIIEDFGYKGQQRGNIRVSNQHANFIVNNGSGSSVDVLALVHEIRDAVRAKTGLTMQPEFRYVHPLEGIQEV